MFHAHKFSTGGNPMKLAPLLALILLLSACSHKMHGTVMDDGKVDFGDGVVGTCVFDNQPQPGDAVTVNDKDGKCHATPKN
jgi:hypothetical protein